MMDYRYHLPIEPTAKDYKSAVKGIFTFIIVSGVIVLWAWLLLYSFAYLLHYRFSVGESIYIAFFAAFIMTCGAIIALLMCLAILYRIATEYARHRISVENFERRKKLDKEERAREDKEREQNHPDILAQHQSIGRLRQNP